jgi:DNA replicative helicase MCM subunit Mcm2 (Cdc46/Mcm family)
MPSPRALPVTARTLETIIRLATASCKVCLRYSITLHDVDVAVGILEHCMNKDVGGSLDEDEEEMQELEDEDAEDDDGMDEEDDEEKQAKKRCGQISPFSPAVPPLGSARSRLSCNACMAL